MNSAGVEIVDKVTVSELRRNSSNRKLTETSMKTLIAQEVLNEVETNHNLPSVVAKLMGLDALPQQPPDFSAQRSDSEGCLCSCSGLHLGCWQQERDYMDMLKQNSTREYPVENGCRDVYEVWQQSRDRNYIREISLHKGRHNEITAEKKMAFLRQKFVEAKRLATDENLRQSKQFQDALEILSSNRGLFLKFLQEPNSLFSQRFCNLQTIPPPAEKNRITVLRPCNMVVGSTVSTSSAKKIDKKFQKSARMGQFDGWDRSSPAFSPYAGSWKADDSTTQPTRIVVLKPTSGKPRDAEGVVSAAFLSPRVLHGEEFSGEPEDEARDSIELAEEITQMPENLSGYGRDETQVSSVFSNGYVGDESSFNKSEDECAVGDFSDSERISPASRHSWDYINRLGSPNSSSSFSRPSYSPESSVCREARKQLSERWAMMTSTGSSQEQRHIRKNSSTLGEMLALSDTKRTVRPIVGSYKEQEPRGSTSCLNSDSSKDQLLNTCPSNLLRSKSLPVSSMGTRLNVEVSDSKVIKGDVTKYLADERSTKSSFKGKVSNLFFSRNKKLSREKSSTSLPKDESQSQCIVDARLEECVLPDLHETGLSVRKHLASGNTSENQDQPSPISVLEPTFEDDDRTTPEFSVNVRADRPRLELSAHPLKSNLIDKSPPIGSIARSVSWGNSCADIANSYPLQPLITKKEEQEQEWFFFVEKLLSAAGLHGEVQSDTCSARWHTPESPLDPSLRSQYVHLNEKESVHVAKRGRRSSTQKLVFDCVNAALVGISGYGSDLCQRAIPCSVVGDSTSTLMELVWDRMKEWLAGEVRCIAGDDGDSDSLVVEVLLRKEVGGKGWVDQLRLEIGNLGKEIGAKLLEELVQDAVVELTRKV